METKSIRANQNRRADKKHFFLTIYRFGQQQQLLSNDRRAQRDTTAPTRHIFHCLQSLYPAEENLPLRDEWIMLGCERDVLTYVDASAAAAAAADASAAAAAVIIITKLFVFTSVHIRRHVL